MELNIILEMLKKQEQTLNQIKKELSTTQAQVLEIDFSQISSLSERLQTSVSKIDEAVEAVRKPVISERKFTFNLESRSTVFIFIGMLVIIASLSSWLYFATRPNFDRIDNDLKYRYIKMKGEATPQCLTDLEELFNINRDNDKIQEMHQTVETYEETVRKQVIIDEQTRLKQQESKKLYQEATELKEK